MCRQDTKAVPTALTGALDTNRFYTATEHAIIVIPKLP